MRSFLLLIALPLLLMSCGLDTESSSAKKPSVDVKMLVDYMKGYYSSEAQSMRDTNYLNILLAMEPIWTDRTDGPWIYVEQTASSTPKKPYRQRVYHLEQVDDSTFTSTIYKLKSDSLYIGGHRNTAVFNSLSPDGLELLDGCALSLHYADGVFSGSTDGRACTNTWGAAQYATSEATLYPDSLISWDRGYNDSGEQVWGAETGGYHFVKMASGM